MATYIDSLGQQVVLGQKIGQGGEGSVFEIRNRTDIVAKIYHHSLTGPQEEKLLVMIGGKNDELSGISAWPIDILYSGNGTMAHGFIMQRIDGYHPVHELYGPKSRRTQFPSTDWRFLIHAATNISRAFVVIHKHNHVIGDVNHGNLVVAKDGKVKLIDCDSFQITQGSKQFYCTVGVPEYTPPELSGLNFDKHPRNTNHDNFGLAVLIFHLLFLGRHPFAGVYLGHGYMPIDRAIKENRFVYGADSHKKLMAPPPHSLQVNSISGPLLSLFESAFEGNSLFHARPDAAQWVSGLTEFSKNLKLCLKTPTHYYSADLNFCTWCNLEEKSGIDFFPSAYFSTINFFNPEQFWEKVRQIKRPAMLSATHYTITEPSENAVKSKKYLKFRWLILIGIIVLGSVLIIALAQPMAFIFLSLLAILLRRLLPDHKKITEKFEWKVSEAKAKFNGVLSPLKKEIEAFDQEMNNLKRFKEEYGNLPMVKAKEVETLKTNIFNNQLNKFLERFEIKDGTIKGIGDGRRQMLLSFGIESAAEISAARISTVPGFGPAFTKNLLEWRKECEKSFRFDSSKGIDPMDMAKLDKKINDRRIQLEARMKTGADTLGQTIGRYQHLKKTASAQAKEISMQINQAEFDFKYIIS